MSMFKEYEEDDERYDYDPLPVTCPIGDRQDCEYFKLAGGCRNCDDMEWYCQHPELDEEIVEEYCPIIVENILAE